MAKNLNDYIKKSHIKAVEKFSVELEAFRKETGDDAATLYEDPFTSFTLANPRVEDGYLCYLYDGKEERDMIVRQDEETGEYWEDELLDGIMDTVKFWRKCLKRAKKFWEMDPDHIDAIQNGEAEYNDLDEEG